MQKHYHRPYSRSERFASKEVKSEIYERDQGLCRYCGIDLDSRITWHADHVISWPKGRTEIDNLVAACVACNANKYTEYWEPLPIGTTREQAEIIHPKRIEFLKRSVKTYYDQKPGSVIIRKPIDAST